MLDIKDKGILLQIIKRCNRVIEKNQISMKQILL